MATHPIGPDTANLSVNMPKEMKARLEALARRSHLKLGQFCRAVIEDALQRKMRVDKEVKFAAPVGANVPYAKSPDRTLAVAEDAPNGRRRRTK